MKTSWKGRAFIAREEGCVLSAYKDTVGVWTIGFGHTSAAGPPTVAAGLKLSLAECLDLFERDLLKYENAVNWAFSLPLTQSQFDAAVSFHYNTGAIGRASWVKQFNSGDVAGAGRGIMNWRKPPAIIGRRRREQRLFTTGDYGDLSGLSVWTTRGGKALKMPFPGSNGDLDVVRNPRDDVPAKSGGVMLIVIIAVIVALAGVMIYLNFN